MTDNEIIKALECCVKNDIAQCTICSYYHMLHGCRRAMEKDVLDLINRQKAEIDTLKAERSFDTVEQLKTAKSEAVKEFARRARGMVPMSYRVKEYFEDLVKEMTEGKRKCVKN